jgi:hypothetical protein
VETPEKVPWSNLICSPARLIKNQETLEIEDKSILKAFFFTFVKPFPIPFLIFHFSSSSAPRQKTPRGKNWNLNLSSKVVHNFHSLVFLKGSCKFDFLV